MTDIHQKPIHIFDELRKLNFPTEQFIVVGSGIMAAKGIRDAYDLDIIVSQELFDSCKNSGWELKPWTRSGRPGKDWLKGDNVDLMIICQCGEEDLYLEDLKKEGEKVNGVWFLSLKQLIKFKREYGRQKDFDDIALMEKYLNEHTV